MNENKHTPEPWRAFNNGQGVVGVSTDRSDVCWTRIEEGGWLDSDRTIDADYENARRIVACVNRLAQFTTEQIEDFGYDLFAEDRPRLVEAQNEIHLLKKQRDELLSALERIRKQQETIGATGNSAWTTADFAIASVKGESA